MGRAFHVGFGRSYRPEGCCIRKYRHWLKQTVLQQYAVTYVLSYCIRRFPLRLGFSVNVVVLCSVLLCKYCLNIFKNGKGRPYVKPVNELTTDDVIL
uniref:Uncharacterized protein n=1 Tax=Romanomermis culicivorax TaxID=13658 RepID=A0A915IQH0_ROMCU